MREFFVSPVNAFDSIMPHATSENKLTTFRGKKNALKKNKIAIRVPTN